MQITPENILLVGSILIFLSLIIGKTSFKLGIPVLVFFLILGMVAGSEGIGGIYFDNPKIAQFIGIVALNFILFAGGIETNWKSTRSVVWQGVSLSTLGVILTAVSLGTFVWLITDFSFFEALLLGSIVSSTDAAAVFSILRSKNLALKHKLRPTLEFESGSNDPMAYFLTIAFTGMIVDGNQNFWSIFPFFLKQFLIGGLAGLLFGRITKTIINRIGLHYDGLYPVLVITMMFFTFSVTDFFGGNGFLAVYLSAIYLGNHEFIHKNTIIKMFDGLAWLMQIILFLTLGLLIFPSHIVPFIGLGLLISAFLILIARPLGVFLSLLPFKIQSRSRLFISWVGLRGAVPIVFATYPLIAGLEKADIIFNIVFFISLTSIVIQGTTIPFFAKFFHVAMPAKIKPVNPVDIILGDNEKSEMLEVKIPEKSEIADKKILDINFPGNALIAVIHRNNNYIIPNGSTTIETGDNLIILYNDGQVLPEIFESLGINEENIVR